MFVGSVSLVSVNSLEKWSPPLAMSSVPDVTRGEGTQGDFAGPPKE